MSPDVTQEHGSKAKRLGMSNTFVPLVNGHIVSLREKSQHNAAVNVIFF